MNSGFLLATYTPFHIDTLTKLSSYALAPEEATDFERRWKLLQQFDDRLGGIHRSPRRPTATTTIITKAQCS